MTIYATYLKALLEHSKALSTIVSSYPVSFLSTVQQDKIGTIQSTLGNVTASFQDWVSSYCFHLYDITCKNDCFEN